MGEPVLYDYWRSSAAYRVRIALGLAGLTWRSVDIDLPTGRNRTPEHVARNPQGLVPALDIDGAMLTQSLSIVEYLDETRGLGLLPREPAARQRVRALSYAIAMEIHPVCNISVPTWVQEASGGVITVEDWMGRFIPRGLSAFEMLLDHPATGLFCHGDTVTMADLCLVPQLYNAWRWNIPLDPWPRLAEIAARAAALPAFAAAHPDRHRPEA